jgi:hypothetical protein
LLPGPFVALNSVLLHYTFDTSLLEELKVEMIIIFMTISTKKKEMISEALIVIIILTNYNILDAFNSVINIIAK